MSFEDLKSALKKLVIKDELFNLLISSDYE